MVHPYKLHVFGANKAFMSDFIYYNLYFTRKEEVCPSFFHKASKGYDPHKLHVVRIPKGKYVNRNFQYGRYSRNDVSCSHDYCADPNNIIFEVSIVSNVMRSDKNYLLSAWKYTPNLDEVILKARPSLDVGMEARILQIGWIYWLKWNIFEKPASKNKHPIKIRFSIWSLQSDNPEKK